LIDYPGDSDARNFLIREASPAREANRVFGHMLVVGPDAASADLPEALAATLNVSVLRLSGRVYLSAEDMTEVVGVLDPRDLLVITDIQFLMASGGLAFLTDMFERGASPTFTLVATAARLDEIPPSLQAHFSWVVTLSGTSLESVMRPRSPSTSR
jgi:Holliday junction resolvasome RuvABC ATP-dependent DNA helicase subunit